MGDVKTNLFRRFINLFRRSKVAVAFLVFNAVAVPIWLLRTYEEDRVARTRSGVSTVSAATGDGDLRLDAWTNASRVSATDMLPFSIAIQNPSSKTEVTDVRFVAFDAADGFTVPKKGDDVVCWSREGQPKPICTTIDNLTVRPARWPITIAPGSGATVATRLLAVDERGRWYLTAVVAWTDTAHHLSRRKGISLGPIVVESAGRKYLLLLLVKAAQTYVRDLFWPEVAALFAVWVQRQDKRREQSERLAQESRAMVQQTWTLMLPTSHRNNEKSYMPISATSGLTHGRFARIGTDRFAADECFYFVWQIHKLMHDHVMQHGGVYLKNRRGEEIVAGAWNVIKSWTDSIIAPYVTTRSPRAIREDAVSLFPRRRITFAQFSDHVVIHPPFPDLRLLFLAAFAQPAAANVMTVFELLELVIDFEINRAYVYWYGGEKGMVLFPTADYEDIAGRFTDSRAKLTNPTYQAALDKLATEISRYREEI
ncbi:MAG TPA: hypothetical protein VLC46_09170 [Thermoanaerobaculia bacterium]|nr:hypothetical protein [Thermoanaerobaculia bacterium]